MYAEVLCRNPYAQITFHFYTHCFTMISGCDQKSQNTLFQQLQCKQLLCNLVDKKFWTSTSLLVLNYLCVEW